MRSVGLGFANRFVVQAGFDFGRFLLCSSGSFFGFCCGFIAHFIGLGSSSINRFGSLIAQFVGGSSSIVCGIRNVISC